MLIEKKLAKYFNILDVQYELIDKLCQNDGLKACLDKMIQ